MNGREKSSVQAFDRIVRAFGENLMDRMRDKKIVCSDRKSIFVKVVKSFHKWF